MLCILWHCITLQRRVNIVNVVGGLATNFHHNRCQSILRLICSLAVCTSEAARQGSVWQTVGVRCAYVTVNNQR